MVHFEEVEVLREGEERKVRRENEERQDGKN
jgi:hypothetical protein